MMEGGASSPYNPATVCEAGRCTPLNCIAGGEDHVSVLARRLKACLQCGYCFFLVVLVFFWFCSWFFLVSLLGLLTGMTRAMEHIKAYALSPHVALWHDTHPAWHDANPAWHDAGPVWHNTSPVLHDTSPVAILASTPLGADRPRYRTNSSLFRSGICPFRSRSSPV